MKLEPMPIRLVENGGGEETFIVNGNNLDLILEEFIFAHDTLSHGIFCNCHHLQFAAAQLPILCDASMIDKFTFGTFMRPSSQQMS